MTHRDYVTIVYPENVSASISSVTTFQPKINVSCVNLVQKYNVSLSVHWVDFDKYVVQIDKFEEKLINDFSKTKMTNECKCISNAASLQSTLVFDYSLKREKKLKLSTIYESIE